MTNTDITKIKQQIGADNFNILFTKAGFENQFMEEYKNVYKQLYMGMSKGEIQNDGFLYINLYMQQLMEFRLSNLLKFQGYEQLRIIELYNKKRDNYEDNMA